MQYWRLTLAATLTSVAGVATAGVSASEAAKLGNELTPVGAIAAGNEDGSIPEWKGQALFNEEQLNLTRSQLEEWRKNDPVKVRNMVYSELEKRESVIGDVISKQFTITAQNYKEHADKLTAGHKALFEKYPGYTMPVYKTVRTGFFPEEIYEATKKNATSASLEGTDNVNNAKLGFPFPIPKSGAEAIWNHKLKFRGSAVKRFNNQAIVKPDGDFKISKLIEDVKFKYANIEEPGGSALLAYYLSEVIAPARVAGQLTLVHETADEGSGGRLAWIFNPGLGRVNRAPDVGYDNPYIGTDGEQFNDQVDVFNGSLDRYDWKLVGRKEMYIPYHSYEINSPEYKYTDMIRANHLNQDLTRYELHRVWVVDATVRDGTRHQFKRRTFYLDEDSWSIAVVDCYDNRDELWKVQEAHLITLPFVPTVTGAPETIYDLQTGRYFLTALTNEDEVSDFEITYQDNYFTPANLKRKARR
ncbi:MAG: DUF1329 domain-containing protein [Oceanococcaceae bacterium]